MKFTLRLLASLIVLSFPVRSLDACGPSPEDFYPYYHPSLAGADEFVDFWFDPSSTMNSRLMALDKGTDIKDSFSAFVIQDWNTFSKNKFTEEQLHKGLFTKMKPEKSAFVKWLYKQKGGRAYYELMHECSEFTTYGDAWDNIAWAYDNNDIGRNVLAGNVFKKIDELKSSKLDDFIRGRLSYLELRLCYYTNKTQRLRSIFENEFNSRPKDWLYYSANYYYAISFGESKEYNKELLALLRKSRDKKGRILDLLYFNLTDMDDDFVANLPEESRYDLLAMKILRDPRSNSLEDLKKLISMEPNNPFIPLLLTREINKAEQFYHVTFTNNWYSTFWDEQDWEVPGNTHNKNAHPIFYKYKNLNYHKKALAQKMMPTYDILKMAYATYPKQSYKLMLAYAEIFVNKADDAVKKLNEIIAKPESTELLEQTKQIRLLAHGYMGNWDNPEFQKGVLTLFSPEGENRFNYANSLKYQTLSNLAALSAIDKNYTLAYFLEEGYYYADILDFAPSVAVYDNILNELNKPSTAFYAKLVKASGHGSGSNYSVKKAKAQFLLRNYRFKEGVELWKSITNAKTDSTRQLFLVNYEGRNTYMDQYYWVQEPTHKVLDQLLDFVEKSKIPGKDQPVYEFLVGNALLSMCNSGDNSDLASNMRYYHKPQYPTEPSVMNFFSGKMAEPWFRKAFNHCKDPKLAALITIQWGASNPYIEYDEYGWAREYGPKSSKNTAVEKYRKKFPNQPYFDEFISDCDNIRMYYSKLNWDYDIN